MGVDDDHADEALLVAGRRDAEAFGLFYRRRVDAVLAFFLRRTGDRQLAADLTAETFAAALSALPRYSPELSSALVLQGRGRVHGSIRDHLWGNRLLHQRVRHMQGRRPPRNQLGARTQSHGTKP